MVSHVIDKKAVVTQLAVHVIISHNCQHDLQHYVVFETQRNFVLDHDDYVVMIFWPLWSSVTWYAMTDRALGCINHFEQNYRQMAHLLVFWKAFSLEIEHSYYLYNVDSWRNDHQQQRSKHTIFLDYPVPLGLFSHFCVVCCTAKPLFPKTEQKYE